ncbi:MAG TPA: hypothetical protein VJ865_02105 [Gemmatimonadaceae bacterium]|nr:hypothetical protein [Gemmatimonadaceae bacterium]
MKRGKKSASSELPKSSPEMVVLSRENVEQYEPTKREICISISDPSAAPARLSPRFLSVLRLWFSDVVESEDPADILFALDHATSISEFLEAAPDVDRIVLHCNMGVSRSPGVALGLCDLHGWATAELERKHPGWNRLVRSVMREYAKSEKARRHA